jgi:hypothetical protein
MRRRPGPVEAEGSRPGDVGDAPPAGSVGFGPARDDCDPLLPLGPIELGGQRLDMDRLPVPPPSAVARVMYRFASMISLATAAGSRPLRSTSAWSIATSAVACRPPAPYGSVPATATGPGPCGSPPAVLRAVSAGSAAGQGAGGGDPGGPFVLAGGGAADDPQGEQAAQDGEQVGQDLHAR